MTDVDVVALAVTFTEACVVCAVCVVLAVVCVEVLSVVFAEFPEEEEDAVAVEAGDDEAVLFSAGAAEVTAGCAVTDCCAVAAGAGCCEVSLYAVALLDDGVMFTLRVTAVCAKPEDEV